ncbi:MAG TPA: NADH-quinone oxidoreductase subunit NuoF [Myxococcales bacterium]
MFSISVGTGTCGVAAGAEKVLEELRRQTAAKKLDAKVLETGCVGMCYAEVLVEVCDGKHRYLYSRVTPEKVGRIVDEHVTAGRPVSDWLALVDEAEGPESGFLRPQKHIVLRNCGRIDPMSLSDYLARDGYQALDRVLASMSPEQVIAMITESGLRGRGGAGFPTGVKWKLARQSPGDLKYVICNADEGDPGAFMDRSVLEGDPHSVLEGMAICGYAIGATEGYIYCRAEYPKALVRFKHAIAEAEKNGYLGEKVLGKGPRFHVKVKEGAGAFVCGEETALIASIEGKRGMPRLRPPYPAASGLWGKPTNINNVETFANVPWIVLNGARAFAAMGTDKSKGSKVFAMAGKVKRPGLVEVPMGISVNEIVFDVCGGIVGDGKLKAVQMGGPSGGCIPAELGDTKIDYEQLVKTGAIMGSGGMIVMDESTCMVEMARFFLEFTQNESCGKCTSCRIGSLRMLEILQRIVDGKGKDGDLDLLVSLGEHIRSTSLCGLGQTAPNPVLSTLRYFRAEYEEHIQEKRCRAHSCPLLVSYVVSEAKCSGCELCVKGCPVGAIAGAKKKAHHIDMAKCIKCGKCMTACNLGAIEKV